MITWRTRKGEKPLSEMSDLHIANALAWIVERDKDAADDWLDLEHNGRSYVEWVDLFTKELRARFCLANDDDVLPPLKKTKVGRFDGWVPEKKVKGWRIKYNGSFQDPYRPTYLVSHNNYTREKEDSILYSTKNAAYKAARYEEVGKVVRIVCR